MDTGRLQTHINFEWREFVAHRVLPYEQMREATIRTIAPMTMESLVFQMRQCILVRPVKEVTVEWPADWWQHLKQRFAPSWFTRRWPVALSSRTLSLELMYPDLVASTRVHGHSPKAVVSEDGKLILSAQES